jgi:hypothetical protein
MIEQYPGLVAQVAERLTGRPVEVRYRAPVIRLTLGMAYKRRGAAVVDVLPGMPEAQEFYVLLHELAHIQNDFSAMTDCDFADDPPHSRDWTAAERYLLRFDRREEPANAQAFDWLFYAEEHRSQAGSSLSEDWLLALAGWPGRAPARNRFEIGCPIADWSPSRRRGRDF